MDLKDIGKRIRENRIEKSWSQEVLAEKANLSTAYIGMIERGEKTPKLVTFIRIATSLEVSTDELLIDVIHKGYQLRFSKYFEKIENLESKEQKRLFDIIEAFLQ